MKTKLTACLLALTSVFAMAEESRTWTEVSTNRSIEGVMTDKKQDNSAALIVLNITGRSHWVNTVSLSSQGIYI